MQMLFGWRRSYRLRTAVSLRGHALPAVKGFGKIQTVIKTDGVGNGCNGQSGMLQQITRLLDSKIGQIFLGRGPKYRFEGSEQVTAA